MCIPTYQDFRALLNCTCILHVASFFNPPRNRTVCKGRDVTIDCGYEWFISPVTWIINGTSFNESTTINSPLYQHNRVRSPKSYSFTVFSLNYTTTFQCNVKSDPELTSIVATATATNGKIFCEYNYTVLQYI